MKPRNTEAADQLDGLGYLASMRPGHEAPEYIDEGIRCITRLELQ